MEVGGGRPPLLAGKSRGKNGLAVVSLSQAVETRGLVFGRQRCDAAAVRLYSRIVVGAVQGWKSGGGGRNKREIKPPSSCDVIVV